MRPHAADMLGPAVLRDLQVEDLAAAFKVQTAAGRDALLQRLSEPTADTTVIQKRQQEQTALRAKLRSGGDDSRNAILTATRRLKELEPDVANLATAGADERHAEWYSQILWSASGKLAWLNELGWLTELIVLFRTIVLPGLAGILPLIVFVAPLVFAAMKGQALNFTTYMDTLTKAIKQSLPSVMGKPRFAGRGGVLEAGEQFAHVGASVAMFVASLWSQVAAALKMRVVVADMRRRAAALQEYTATVRQLADLIGHRLDSDICLDWTGNTLGTFGAGWNRPAAVQRLLSVGGHLDMLVAVARAGRTCIPRQSTAICLTDMWHPGSTSRRVYNSIQLGGARPAHALLTGPNRGGKTTALRALGAAVLMSQTLGVVFARSAELPVFGSIQTALSPSGVLGEKSLFEAEIDFARSIRDSPARPMFLMMDEIFHGTNAHDGVEAAQVFLDWLYDSAAAAPGIFSVISTHYLELPRRYDAATAAQHLCMEAAQDADDPERLRYSYRLIPGINGFSSVREILRERGLLR